MSSGSLLLTGILLLNDWNHCEQGCLCEYLLNSRQVSIVVKTVPWGVDWTWSSTSWAEIAVPVFGSRVVCRPVYDWWTLVLFVREV